MASYMDMEFGLQQPRVGEDEGIWSPFLTYLTIHVVTQLATVWGLHHSPLALIVFFLFSWIPYAYSYIAGVNIWNYAPGTTQWTMYFVKWLIVCFCAAIPMLAIKQWRLSQKATNAIGLLLNFVLAANILWTLGFGLEGNVAKFNGFVAIMLVVSQCLQIIALWCNRDPLAELGEHMIVVYFTTTPTRWILSYTIWNAVFAAQGGLAGAQQDVYFLCMMFYFARLTGYVENWGYYFGFVRGSSLGMYIVVATVAGMFPYITEAPKDPPLNQYWVSLFLVYVNIVLVVYNVAVDLTALLCAKDKESGSDSLWEKELDEESEDA